jgi:DNA-directed RNA polymerase subunit RPC12/RpoP
MKKCKECGDEFQPHQTRGHEQIYCTQKCRNRASVKRRETRLQSNGFIPFQESINQNLNLKNEKEKLQGLSENRGNPENMATRFGREIPRAADGIGTFPDSHLETIKDLYHAKTETNFYKIKCESLEKEISELKTELEEIEEEAEKNSNSGILGGMIEQFKQDPVNTINFATEVIGKLFNKNKK